MTGIPPLDPHVAARNGIREAAVRSRRFWKDVDVRREADGWAVTLDGRIPKTPAGARVVLPTKASALMVVEDWASQGEFLDPSTMPCQRLTSTAIDRVSKARAAVVDEIAAYAGSDALCYLVESPDTLVRRQEGQWRPWRDWAARELGVGLEPRVGVTHRAQSPDAIARVAELASALDDFALAGLGLATPLFGSAVLGLALQRGAGSGGALFDTSRLEEDFQEERWGVDEEAAVRTAARRAEAQMLDRWFRALEG